MKSRFVEKWQLMSADQNYKWSIAPGVLHNLIEEACEEIEKLIAVARAAIEWRDTRGDENHPAARSRLALTVERLCPSTKWWCEQCDVEFIAAIGTPCPECGGTGDPR